MGPWASCGSVCGRAVCSTASLQIEREAPHYVVVELDMSSIHAAGGGGGAAAGGCLGIVWSAGDSTCIDCTWGAHAMPVHLAERSNPHSGRSSGRCHHKTQSTHLGSGCSWPPRCCSCAQVAPCCRPCHGYRAWTESCPWSWRLHLYLGSGSVGDLSSFGFSGCWCPSDRWTAPLAKPCVTAHLCPEVEGWRCTCAPADMQQGRCSWLCLCLLGPSAHQPLTTGTGWPSLDGRTYTLLHKCISFLKDKNTNSQN